jgi:hypothetical protein
MSVPKYRWRDSAGWLRWGPRAIDGEEVSFEHLREFDMVLTRPAHGTFPALRVPIRVVFDCHVVTEADLTVRAESVADNPLYWVDSAGDEAFANDHQSLKMSPFTITIISY